MSDTSLYKKRAFSTLPTVLFLGGLIVEVTIGIAFMLNLLGTTHLAASLSADAFAVADAGLKDGIIKVIRNKDCPTASCTSPFTLNVGTRTANVEICKDSCEGVGKTRIDSLGSARAQRRKLRAVLTVDSNTGQVSVDSVSEIAL